MKIHGLRVLLVVLLLSPLFLAILSLPAPNLSHKGDLTEALFMSVYQSTMSASLSLLTGLFGALGLCSISSKRVLGWTESLMMSPIWLPSLFVILSILNLLTHLGRFPFGFWGVVIIHTSTYFGFISVVLFRAIQSKMGRQLEVALVAGASRYQALKWIVIPQLKIDLIKSFCLVFVLSLTGLSAPLLVGNGISVTLDVFAYYQLQAPGGLAVAHGIAWIEVVILTFIGLYLSRQNHPRVQQTSHVKVIGSRLMLTLSIGFSVALIATNATSFFKGLSLLQKHQEIFLLLPGALFGTFMVANLAAGVTLLLSLISIYSSPHRGLRKWILSISTPSYVLIGLALYYYGPRDEVSSILKTGVGLSIALFPGLYRWVLDTDLEGLRDQVHIARIQGANVSQIFWKILLPQMSQQVGLACALAFLWAAGDFALSGIILRGDQTLALLIESLMSAYRLELSTLLMSLLVVLSLVGAFFYTSVCYVIGRKSIS